MIITLKQAAQQALEALEEIALAGMSGTGQESEEGMRDWHARQAWKFIGIAARALDPLHTAIQRAEANADEPVAWIRRHPNGALSNELLIHVQVEQLRRDSGAWVPLYTHPAPSVPMAKAWAEGYRQGIEDERISEANIGIAGFGAKVNPSRQNPYSDTHPAPGVPDGFALVPLKATPKVAMVLYEGARNCFSPKVAEGLWQDALTAAQAQKGGA